jgi:hypothetical protein
VIWVGLSTVNDFVEALPNLTAFAPVKFTPLMATLVLPEVGPDDGLTLVTAGA